MENKPLFNVSILSGPVPYKVIEVVWDDASTDNGWDNVKKTKPELCLTMGFLVYAGEEHIVVASSICEGTHDTNCRLQIPIGMIKHIREIE